MGGKVWKRFIYGTMAQVPPGYIHGVIAVTYLHSTVLVLGNDYFIL